MFAKIKTTTAMVIAATLLMGCATQQNPGGMNTGSSMCKEMMEQGKCGCCQNMRTFSTTSKEKPMQCMTQKENKTEGPVAEMPEVLDATEHKAHHPENAQ